MKNKKIFLAAGIAAILAVFGIGVMAGAFFRQISPDHRNRM